MNPTKNHQEPFAFRIEIEGLRRIAEDLRVHRNGISGILALLALIFLFCPIEMRANVPGGGNGKGSGVTVTDNGETVTMGNGIVSMVIEKSTARLNSVTYTHANSGAPLGSEMLKGKGQFWYGGFPLGGHTFTYSLSTNPASNGGNYGDVMLLNTSENHGIMEVHFSMLRGSQGFYTTATQIHRSQDAACEVGAWGFLCRVPLDFHWVSIDPMRNFSLGEMGTQKGARVPDSAHEVSVLFDGGMQGQFDDKFIYAQNYGDAQAWGWSSVGQGGLNVGIWLMTGMEFGDGGPLKRDVATSHDHGLNNPMLTGEVGMGSDGNFSNGELWTKTCGPCFFYVNSIPGSITDPSKAAHLLYQDALAQHAAEEAAWPYAWFKNANYVPASGRGMVTGRFVIQDSGNPNASASGLWVGLEQQPRTTNGTDDFQKWLKPYQYWMKTDANGNFAIPNVIAGNSYTLWAYGPGAAGTFLSQNQTGGNPPLECDLPEKPFAVNVAAGGTTALGTVTWTPARLGATVFELGYPNRQANKFRHGEDYWVPEIAPKLGYPTPVWGGQMEYPLDYPDGMTYTVGKSRWDRDWNYVLPSSPDASGADQPCTGTIHFTLPRAPAAGAKAAIYLACAGDDGGHIILGVNGGNLGSAMGVSAAPEPVAETGYTPPYEDDSSAHFSDHGPFSDERIAFPGAMLHAGDNTLTIQMGAKSGVAYLMVDYLRLELTGYVPPAPPGVAAFAGSSRNLLCWLAAPGATSYNILRSGSGAGYIPIAANIPGPVLGSGTSLATYTDMSATNGTEYHYVVQSVNPVGTSGYSPASEGVMPAPGLASARPAVPEGLSITRSGHHEVVLRWNATPASNYYRVWRTTLHPDGVGGFYPLRSIILDEATARASYTDNSPTDGDIYSYSVEAANAAGTSGPSATVMAQPLPPPPEAAPGSLTGHWVKTRNGPAITLNWSAVPGAAGYVVYRSTGSHPTFRWPENFLTTLVETTYTDKGDPKKGSIMKGDLSYSYQVTAVNAGGTSASTTIQVPASNGGNP